MDNFKFAPIDTIIYLIDEFNILYIGTITKVNGELRRGECYAGDPDTFYRTAIVNWAYFI